MSKFEATAQSTLPSPFGIISKPNISDPIQSIQPEFAPSDTHNIFTIPEIDKDRVVNKALSMAELADHVQGVIGKTSTVFSYHMMPFMTYVPSFYMHCSASSRDTEEQAHHQWLSNILIACNLRMHKIAGDGNCFSSIAFSLSKIISQMNDQSKENFYGRRA